MAARAGEHARTGAAPRPDARTEESFSSTSSGTKWGASRACGAASRRRARRAAASEDRPDAGHHFRYSCLATRFSWVFCAAMSDADRLFEQIDTNKSGTIDANELLKHLLQAASRRRRSNAPSPRIDTGRRRRQDSDVFAAARRSTRRSRSGAPHFHHARRRCRPRARPAAADSTAGADTSCSGAQARRAHRRHAESWRSARRSRRRTRTCSSTRRRCAAVHYPAQETKDGDRCTFSGAVALSYAWARRADPDPQRATAALRPVLVVVDVRARAADERRRAQRVGGEPDATIQTADFGVFIDFMSMFQSDDTTGAKPGRECGRAGVVRPRAAQHRPALRPRRHARVQDDRGWPRRS